MHLLVATGAPNAADAIREGALPDRIYDEDSRRSYYWRGVSHSDPWTKPSVQAEDHVQTQCGRWAKEATHVEMEGTSATADELSTNTA